MKHTTHLLTLAGSQVLLGLRVPRLGVGMDPTGNGLVEYGTVSGTGVTGILAVGDNAANPQFGTFVTGDGFQRFTFLAGGEMKWGSGSVAADTNLYRSAANTLKTDDNFIIASPGAVAGSAATIDGTQTLTAKTISGASNTLSNIAISSLLITGTPDGTKFLRDDGSWQVPSGGGGSGTFIGLTDVPASYTGEANKFVKVNAGETALEFATIPGGGDMLASVYDPDNVAEQLLGLTAVQTGITNKTFVAPEWTGTAAGETLTLGTAATATGTIKFFNGLTAFAPTVGPSASTSADYDLVLPPALGSAGSVLTDTAGDGVLSFQMPEDVSAAITAAFDEGLAKTTIYIDKNTDTLSGDATGTINRPFDNVTDAVAFAHASAFSFYVFHVIGGDYSAESTVSLIENKRYIFRGAARSPTFALLPAFTWAVTGTNTNLLQFIEVAVGTVTITDGTTPAVAANLLFQDALVTGVSQPSGTSFVNLAIAGESLAAFTTSSTLAVLSSVRTNAISFKGDLFLTNTQFEVTCPSITARRIFAFGCSFFQDITLSGTTAEFRNCLWNNSTPSITFSGSAGTVYSDGVTAARFLNALGTVTNGNFPVGRQDQIINNDIQAVINPSGSIITAAKPVYHVGASNGLPTIALSKADAPSTAKVAGLTSISIAASGGTGGILTYGRLEGVDTSAWAAGDTLYVSASTAGTLTNVAPVSPDIPVVVGVVTVSDATAGIIQVDIQPPSPSLASLTDTAISSPLVGEGLGWNGTAWVNRSFATTSAGTGTTFFDATPVIVSRTAPSGLTADGATGNGITVSTLSKTPVTTTEQTLAGLANADTRAFSSRIYDTALGRTSIDAGVWQFSSYMAVNNSAGNTTLTKQVYQVQVPASGTVTVTGAGANSRTVTASALTPFALTGFFAASATNTTASFIYLPSGIYQITGRTSDTVVTIAVPTGYSNESTVAYSVWNKLLAATSATIESTGTDYQLYTFSVTAPAFTVAATDKLGSISFITTDAANRTVTVAYNGTAHNSSFTSPLATLHNDLAGLQGGSANEYFHLTSLEYAGSGTGVFARTVSPVFTTPNIGTATGSITGNAATVTNGIYTTDAVTGTGSLVRATSPTLTTPNLGTPSSLTLTNATGLVATTGLTATGTKNNTTFLRGDDTWATASGGLGGNDLIGPTGQAVLTGTKYRVAFGSNLATGQQDLYTCPSGKRAYVVVAFGYNTSAGSITIQPEIKVSGTYYRIGNDVTLTTLTGGGITNPEIVLEAGEIFAVNLTTTNGLNIWVRIIEFDNTSGFKTAKILALANGNNTLYTCPASTIAKMMTTYTNEATGTGAIKYMNASGASRNITNNVVPSGGSVATGNQAGPLQAGANNTFLSVIAPPVPLAAGDFINVNTNNGTAGQVSWVNVMEIPA